MRDRGRLWAQTKGLHRGGELSFSSLLSSLVGIWLTLLSVEMYSKIDTRRTDTYAENG